MGVNAIAKADSLAPGLRIGRYELIRRLAVGGMAEIYLARATGIEGFEKLVVLKRILPQFAANPDFIGMFLDEARISATLQHPNIAQVYDIGQFEGTYFFTMEYVRGEDLRALLKRAVEQRARIPLEHVVTIAAGAAAGLHAAHEKRGLDGEPLEIVHRDVSPSNVLVSYDGAVKLLDFGVAKAAARQTETQAGTLKGKVSYMSPEQCTGGKIDRRSDIFALGILLYELSTCRRLFKGDSEFAIMTKIVHEDVEAPSRTFRWYPGALERILLKALRRTPDERYATAQEMQLELEEFARRHRLAASTIGLAGYMRESFVDRMRELEALTTRRPRTEEVELEVDIEVDEADAEAERSASASDAAAAIEAAVPAPAPVRHHRWRGLAGALAAAAVVAIALFAGARRNGETRPAAGAAVPEPAAAEDAPAEPPAPEPAPSAAAPTGPLASDPIAPAIADAPEQTDEAKEVEARPSEPPKARPRRAAAPPSRAAQPTAEDPAPPRPATKPSRPASTRIKAPAPRRTDTRRDSEPIKPAAPVPPSNRDWNLDSPLPPPGAR